MLVIENVILARPHSFSHGDRHRLPRIAKSEQKLPAGVDDGTLPAGWVYLETIGSVAEALKLLSEEQKWAPLDKIRAGLSSIRSRYPGASDDLLYDITEAVYVVGTGVRKRLWDDQGIARRCYLNEPPFLIWLGLSRGRAMNKVHPRYLGSSATTRWHDFVPS